MEICGRSPSSECVASNFHELHDRAERGDDYAINALFNTISKCRRAPRSPSEIDNLQVNAIGTTQANANTIAKSMMNSLYVACKGFSSAQLSYLPKLSWMAAEHHNVRAQTFAFARFASDGPGYYAHVPNASEGALASLVEADAKAHPSPEYFLLLSRMYRRGVVMPRDDVKAYAYHMAMNKLYRKEYGNSTEDMGGPIGLELTTEQLQQAGELASSIAGTQ
jgi:hypothetical protein